MKVVGLIAEYNPFHNGHSYHIEMAKKLTGADYVVVVMSGDFVQRGTPAMIQKHARAKMALLGGADLVLELPVSYATATAEVFAYGGVKILDSFGVVDHICFGSECGNADLLMEIARILADEPEWYSATLKEHLKNGMSYPAARAAALPDYQEILSEPNNILGIEYCKALLKLNSNITPVTITRQGAGYHDALSDSDNNFTKKNSCLHNPLSADGLIPQNKLVATNVYSSTNKYAPASEYASANRYTSASGYASASGIREYFKKHLERYGSFSFSEKDRIAAQDYNHPHTTSHANILNNDLIATNVPALVLPVLEKELQENGFTSEDDFSQILLYKLLMLHGPEDLLNYAAMSEELANRVFKQRHQFQSFSQFADLLKTKEITRTRINRALLHFILELDKDLPDAVYGRILGFRKSSASLLSEIKKIGCIPLISKTSAADTLLKAEQFAVFSKSLEAANLYEMILAQRNNRSITHEHQKQVIILP